MLRKAYSSFLHASPENSAPLNHCAQPAPATAELQLGDDWGITPDEALIDALAAWLKRENVEVVYD